MHFNEEEVATMEAEKRELEILDEGRIDAEELNACCTGTSLSRQA
jgi:putative radical SAM-modified peptide